MKSKNADYGWDVDMTIFRALRVLWWRCVKGETWRAIGYEWERCYPENPSLDLNGNQYYGMSVTDCAATKLGMKSYVSMG